MMRTGCFQPERSRWFFLFFSVDTVPSGSSLSSVKIRMRGLFVASVDVQTDFDLFVFRHCDVAFGGSDGD